METLIQIKDIKSSSLDWRIYGKVVKKSIKRQGATSNCPFFFFIVQDQSADIRVVAFRDQCSKWFDQIQKNQNVTISNAEIDISEKDLIYEKPNHKFELIIRHYTQIVVDNNAYNIPVKYNFKPFHNVSMLPDNSRVDIIGAFVSATPVEDHSTDYNESFRTRYIKIKNEDGEEIEVRIRNYPQYCNDAFIAGLSNKIIVIKDLRIIETSSETIYDIGNGSSIEINPEIPEVAAFEQQMNRSLE